MSKLRPPRYLKPMNRVVRAFGKLGIPAGPAQILTVPGRKTGKPRNTPMTPFEHDGGLYTVAGYPGADWAANARAAAPGPSPAAASRVGSRSSNSAQKRQARCCAVSPSKFRSAWVSRSGRGWSATAPRTNSRRSQADSRCSGSTPRASRLRHSPCHSRSLSGGSGSLRRSSSGWWAWLISGAPVPSVQPRRPLSVITVCHWPLLT